MKKKKVSYHRHQVRRQVDGLGAARHRWERRKAAEFRQNYGSNRSSLVERFCVRLNIF